ncbi:MAG: hypothetical protein AAFR47_16730 [Pseudomonadota bacterium]
MQALRLEVAVPGRSFLIAVHRALGAVYVQGDDFGRPPIMHDVDPATWQVSQGGEVVGLCQHLRLERPFAAIGGLL